MENLFLAKLHANGDNPLVEDEDLPLKQRLPKPRLPPTGKITSPRKRPVKEPGPGKGHPRKKLKLNDGTAEGKPADGESVTDGLGDPVKKMPDAQMVNGERMSREPSKNDAPTSAVVARKPLTNGVPPIATPATTHKDVNVTLTAKGKSREEEVNGIGESGSLPSPESLEAT